ncbi:hypothetical protein ACFLTP_06520 [Chloroflexota bacterium]
MKRRIVIAVTITVIVALLIGTTVAFAAKPQNSGSDKDVIALSNGFPSGEHFNMNIHGKKADYIGDSTPGGNSVFILEYGTSTIQYVTNKKSSVTELTALDPLAEAFDGDPAKVQIPYESDGYYVFGRIHGKPNNSATPGNPSSIILYPTSVVDACNDTDPINPDFPDYTVCPEDPLLALGVVVGPNLYIPDPATETYKRFDPGVTKGKGKSKATDITRFFTYTGWVVDSTLDANDDGVIDIDDVPLDDYDGDILTDPDRDYNNDWLENEADVEAWLTDMEDLGQAWYFEKEWILNIADLVIVEGELVNDGTKLLQIRFYPVDTTEFIPNS